MRTDAEANSVLIDWWLAIVESAITNTRGACFPADGETISRHTVKRDG